MHDLVVRQTHVTHPIGTIYCLGRNYGKHIREMGATAPTRPVIFMKPRAALVRDGGTVYRPSISTEMHHEVELVVVIGTGGRDVREVDAYDHILGYAVGVDMTLRDLQSEAKKNGEPWGVAKGFYTSAPMSDVVLRELVPAPHGLELRLHVNGELRQQGTTADMLMKVPAIVSYISTVFSLEPGDCIFTGTPEGVGAVEPGDTVRAEIVGLVSAEWTVA